MAAVKQSARSRRSYRKIGACEQYIYQFQNPINITYIMALQVCTLSAFSLSSASFIHWSLLISTPFAFKDVTAKEESQKAMLVYCSYQGRGVGGGGQFSAVLYEGPIPWDWEPFGSLKQATTTATATKTSLTKWIRAASNFIALIPSRLIHQMLANVLELNSKGLHQSSGKEKGSCCLVFPSSTKREIRHFHVVVVQRRLRNVQKSVMHVQRWVFANISRSIALRFCRSRYRRRHRSLWYRSHILRSENCISFNCSTCTVFLKVLNQKVFLSLLKP